MIQWLKRRATETRKRHMKKFNDQYNHHVQVGVRDLEKQADRKLNSFEKAIFIAAFSRGVSFAYAWRSGKLLHKSG